MKLSILIPATYDRQHYLDKLLSYFAVQIKGYEKEIEILTNIDNREKSIGQKRNELVEQSQGDYVVHFDCDDLPGPTYISSVLKAIYQNPDVIGVRMVMLTNGVLAENSYHSLQFKEWFEIADPLEPSKKSYFRNPHHLCPVKREIANLVKFPEISMGEDHDYSRRLLPFLKTEIWIQEPIYYYLFEPQKTY
jgi:glycosyltransferase involved in cell wall biosynthesis